jgi:dipeptidyl aminopeptidase/acylaminoacyl peptidase
MTELPYGTWHSPISAADVARGGVALEFPGVVDTPEGAEVWWIEERPSDAGRHALVRRAVDGTFSDILGPKWSPRSRIIEYGARPWCRVVSDAASQTAGTVFCFWDDQRLYLLTDGEDTPVPLTSAPTDAGQHMYGEPIAGPTGTVMVVRETHRNGVVSRDLVLVPLDGSAATTDSAVHIANDQHHFYANPRLSPDQERVAYAAWDHPHMPWDSTVIAVVELTDPTHAERVVTGGTDESVLQPEWADANHLYCVSDRSGWWNLYRLAVENGAMTALCPREEEFGQPLWVLGETTYAVLSDGRLAVTHGRGEGRLSVLDPATGELTDLGLGVGIHPEVFASGTLVTSTGNSAALPTSVLAVDMGAEVPQLDIVRQAIDQIPDSAYLPTAVARTFAGPSGREIHAFVYAPKHPEATAPPSDRPPFLVFVHGGPTAHVSPGLSLQKAYFTSRGIGVIDVNYGGSTGYGRAYRERLRGQWGVVDVEDSVAAVLALADAGDADRARLGIRGGSAGGWTTLACLVQSDAFAAGAAYFPVTDLLPFAKDTHDFESRYLDGLVGPLPEAHDLYVDRSPLSHLDQLRTAVLLLQGDDDKVVPPSQPQAVHEALAGSGIPHAYLLFKGEQHGFRMAESQIIALEGELSFFGQIFGFDPPGVPKLPLEY